MLLILLATLNSFDFHFRILTAADYFAGYSFFSGTYLDIPLNVILFMPFGFGLSLFLDQAGFSKRVVFLSTLLAGFGLTLLVESLQFYLPGRSPSVADLLANISGALAGLGCLRLWQNRSTVTKRVKAALSNPRKLAVATAVYLLFLLGIGILIQQGSRLQNWQPTYPLLIGNEQTADRPWQGSVTNLAILDKALSAGEANTLFSDHASINVFKGSLVAFYPLTDAASLYDQTGNLPDLRWQGNSQSATNDKTAQLDGEHWLTTEASPAYLAQRLQTTSEFTLSLTVTAKDLEQSGPARIISVSVDPFLRNMMVGQDGRDLILRVRTPITGENGAVPEWIIPNVFVDQASRHLIITYDGLAIQTFINNSRQANSIEVLPGSALFLAFFGPYGGRIDTIAGKFYSILFYGLIFIPLGILLALLIPHIQQKSKRFLLIVIGVSVPTLLLELILTARNGFDMRIFNIIISAAFITITIVILAFSKTTKRQTYKRTVL